MACMAPKGPVTSGAPIDPSSGSNHFWHLRQMLWRSGSGIPSIGIQRPNGLERDGRRFGVSALWGPLLAEPNSVEDGVRWLREHHDGLTPRSARWATLVTFSS